MSTSRRLSRTVALALLLVLAGCAVAAGDDDIQRPADAARTPLPDADTPVGKPTLPGDTPGSELLVATFVTGPSVCERSNVPARMTISQAPNRS